ncbi:MAG: hypothetical protein ACW99G_06905 [Candidatus Thorarchaeota archaeon]|jgi:hypothetical protein
MLYSCTIFYNEFELLDLKIAEEIEQVDYFYVSEADHSFSYTPKPVHLKEDDRFKDNPKLKLVVTDDFDPNIHPRDNEIIQRNKPLSFIDINPEDFFIVSDVDEIIRRQDIPSILEKTEEHGLIRIGMHFHAYGINLRRGHKAGWNGPYCVTGKTLLETKMNFDQLRRKRKEYPVFKTDGRHFSFLGSEEFIRNKLKNWGHSDVYGKEKWSSVDAIKERKENLLDPIGRELSRIDIDDTYPTEILENMDKWEKYIL